MRVQRNARAFGGRVLLSCIEIQTVQHNDGIDLRGVRVEVLQLHHHSGTDANLLELETLLAFLFNLI